MMPGRGTEAWDLLRWERAAGLFTVRFVGEPAAPHLAYRPLAATRAACRVLPAAWEEAPRRGHFSVRPLHLLHALLGLWPSDAAMVLWALGASVDDLLAGTRSALEALPVPEERIRVVRLCRVVPVAHRSRGQDGYRLAFRSQLVYELAFREADELRHDRLGTGHILLGLLAEGLSLPAGLLAERNVSLEGARTALARLVGSSAGSAEGVREA